MIGVDKVSFDTSILQNQVPGLFVDQSSFFNISSLSNSSVLMDGQSSKYGGILDFDSCSFEDLKSGSSEAIVLDTDDYDLKILDSSFVNCVYLDGSSSSSDGKRMIYHNGGNLDRKSVV